MTTLSRFAILGAATSLFVGMGMAPALAAEDPSVAVTNTETIQVLMDSNANVKSQRVYEQIDLSGKGNVNFANPIETNSLRNLDGFKGFDVKDGNQIVKAQVDGEKRFRTVSDYKKDLPVKISVRYFLDGQPIEAGDVVGKSGKLGIYYTVENRTGETQTLSYLDGKGNTIEKEENVAIPMVGSLTTIAPSNFTDVESKQANMAGDGRGATQLSFTMTLFPPIGSNVAQFGYEADVEDAVVPKASISMLPINPLESPSFAGGAASYKAGAETGQKLTAGAATIDENLLKLRDGANELVAGLILLRDGAGQLSAGLNNEAAPGASELAAGAGKLDAGAGKLDAGAGDLSTGAKKLNAGAGKISDGLSRLNSGLKGDGTLESPGILNGLDSVVAGLNTLDGKLEKDLKQAIVPLINILMIPQLDIAINDIRKVGALTDPPSWGALQVLDTVKAINDGVRLTLTTGDPRIAQLQNASDLAAGLRVKLNDNIGSGADLSGLEGLKKGLQMIADGISTGVGTPEDDPNDDGTPSSLRSGIKALKDGLGKIRVGAEDAVGGVGELNAGAKDLKGGTDALLDGATKLAAGAGTLKGGTGELSAGASKLATGLDTAASGSGELFDGLMKAAAAAPAIPEGAQKLSDEGTSKLVLAGNTTALDYGNKYALIEAGAERAQTAGMAYGAPAEAQGLTAYKFELAGDDGEGSRTTTRGLAALALFAAGGAIAFFRRPSLV